MVGVEEKRLLVHEVLCERAAPVSIELLDLLLAVCRNHLFVFRPHVFHFMNSVDLIKFLVRLKVVEDILVAEHLLRWPV